MARQKKGERVLGPGDRADVRGRWRLIVFGIDGRRSDRLFETKAEAINARRKIEERLTVTAGRTVDEAIDEYEKYMREKGNRARTIETTVYRLNCMFPGVGKSLAGLKDGQKLYDALRSATDAQGSPLYSAASHRNMLAQAKTFLRWCVARGWLKESPLAKVEGSGKKRTGQDKPQLRVDEARRLRDLALLRAKKDRAEGALAALLALMQGLRASEICQLRARDVDDDGRLLWVAHATDESDATGKSRAAARRLKIADSLRPLLCHQIKRRAADEFLLGGGKTPRNRNWVRTWSKKLCRAAGVPEVDAHGLRRTHATLSYAVGATADAMELALGHTSFDGVTTPHYIARGTVADVRSKTANEVLDRDRDKS